MSQSILPVILATAVTCAGAAALHAADSPYLPGAQRVSVGLSASRSQYDNFFLGDKKVSNKDAFGSDEKVTQDTVSLNGQYGLTKRVAVDLTVGYTRVDFKPVDLKNKGRDDTYLGLTTIALDEFDPEVAEYNLPTVAVRVGAIIAGSYDVGEIGVPSAPGLGVNGAEASVILGKYFGTIGFGLTASGGFRHYAGAVPGQLLWSVGAYQSIIDQVVLAGRVHGSRSTTGTDIGGPGFTGYFPGVREEKTEGELSVTYTGLTDSQVGLFAATVFDSGARNTGDATTFGFFVGHLF